MLRGGEAARRRRAFAWRTGNGRDEMASGYNTMPDERDLAALEQRLSALYNELPPGQQELLDTIVAAGLSLLGSDDTAGYVAIPGAPEVRAMHEAKLAELRRDWQQTQAQPADTATPRSRWRLRPVLDWLRRGSAAGASAPTQSAAPGTTSA
jgi:hypothetical protein